MTAMEVPLDYGIMNGVPYTAVESTQDAISNIDINKNSATFKELFQLQSNLRRS